LYGKQFRRRLGERLQGMEMLMPDAVSANYVSDLNVLGKYLRLTVTATGDGDVVATVYDMDSTSSVYLTYEVRDVEQAKEKAEEAALEYLGITHAPPFKWARTV
jgi:hypothetical protein